MKKLMFVIFALAIAGYTCAQKVNDKDLPQAVKSAFLKQFPEVQKVQWGKEGKDYEAEFTLKAVETSAVFDATGVLKETEVELDAAKLPATITDYCTKNFPGYKISEAAKSTNSENVVTYEAEMTKGKDKFDAIFDAKGNFLKKEVEKPGEDKD